MRQLLKGRVHINLAKLKKGEHVFEVDIDPDLAVKFKKGENVNIHEVLKAETVFKDAQKGLVASETLLKEVFGTDDNVEVAKIIIKQGEIQLTSEHRDQLREARKRRIVNIIHQNGIDPRTKLPHPEQRIELAMEEAKVKIDEHKNAEDQINDVIEQLRAVLPISFVKKHIWLHISTQYAPKSQGVVRNFGKIIEEEWGNDGSWIVTVEIPGGMQEEFFEKVNSVTKGTVETKIVKEM